MMASMSWGQAISRAEDSQKARGLLEWFRHSCDSTGKDLLDAFGWVAGSGTSVREYWLQLQLQYMLSKEFERAPEAGWMVLKQEPPAVCLRWKDRNLKDKWPDLLVVKKGPDCHLCWWELKWISDEGKLRRLILDSWLIARLDPGRTIEKYRRRRNRGRLLESMIKEFGAGDGTGAFDAAMTAMKGKHTVAGFAVVTDADLMAVCRAGSPTSPASIPLADFIPRRGDLADAYKSDWEAIAEEIREELAPDGMLAADYLPLPTDGNANGGVGLLAWVHRIQWAKDGR